MYKIRSVPLASYYQLPGSWQLGSLHLPLYHCHPSVACASQFLASTCRVSGPMLNLVQKSVHFMDYLNFGELLDFFLWSICWNLCNFTLVICLLIQNWPNLQKSKNFWWSNHGTKGVEHWVTYPLWNLSSRNRVTPVSIQDGFQHGIPVALLQSLR